MIFSRGKIRKLPEFKYGQSKLDVVFDFVYLGVKFNYNGKCTLAQKYLVEQASKAMYSVLRKSKQMCRPIKMQLELFNTMVVPILLYGAETWGPHQSM